MLVERGGVALEPTFVLQPAFDEVEGDLRQPPLCHPVQVFDIDGLIDPHLRVISRTRGKAATMQHCAFSHHSTIPRRARLGRVPRWADQGKPAQSASDLRTYL